jgi:hypothetical protein
VDAGAKLSAYLLIALIRWAGMSRPLEGGNTMDQVATLQEVQSNTNPNATINLEEAREKIRTLLAKSESNAWEIGDLLNWIERRGLVLSKGYGKTRTWLEAEVPEAQGKASTLYKYANIARHYPKEQVDLWGLTRLEHLIAHDEETVGESVPGNPGERQLELCQEDGSMVVKKFSDCSAWDLRLSNQRRKKARGQSGPRRSRKPGVPGPGSHTNSVPTTKTQVESLRSSVAMLISGGLFSVIGSFLPASLLTTAIFLVGFSLFLGGIGILLRRVHIIRARLLAALESGKAKQLLKEEIAKLRGASQKVLMATRSWIKPEQPKITGEPTEAKGSGESTRPPEEKKAV